MNHYGKDSRGKNNVGRQLVEDSMLTALQKIAIIRAEADAANARADEYEAKYKELEQMQMKQEHDIISLTNQNKHLEEDLELAQEKIKQLKTLEDDGDDLKKENDAAQRKITLLEQELENSELTIRETTKKYVAYSYIDVSLFTHDFLILLASERLTSRPSILNVRSNNWKAFLLIKKRRTKSSRQRSLNYRLN